MWSAEAIISASLVDASLRAFAEELTFVHVDASRFAFVSEMETVLTLAVISSLLRVGAIVMASVVRASALQAVGFVRVIGAVGKGIADSVPWNAFTRSPFALPFAVCAVSRRMRADPLVGIVAAVVDAVANAGVRDADVGVVALKSADGAENLLA